METAFNVPLFLLFAIITVLCASVLNKKNDKEKCNDECEQKGIMLDSIETAFFEKVSGEMKGMRIASIYSYYDVMFIKSFLLAESIPCFFEFENMNKIYGGIPMYGNVNVFLNILEEHYEEVVTLLEAFEKQKKKIHQEKNTMTNKVLGMILGWYVPITHLKTLNMYVQKRNGTTNDIFG